MGGNRRGRLRQVAIACCSLLVIASCGGDDTAAGGSGEVSTPTPTTGGTVTFGSFLPVVDFDPIGAFRGVFGCCGGIEMASVYDVLATYDRESGEYVGRTAESIEPNVDFSEWTVKLRPDIRFADGTPYNADAVVFNVERHLSEESLSASKPVLGFFLDSVTANDDLTVVFQLNQSWSGFPTLLTREVGMIASPSAIEKAGERFGTAPDDGAGAGPFRLAAFRPGENIDLERNPDYWGGEVHLDGIRFVQLGSETSTYESFTSGAVDAMYVRDPEVIARARADDAQSIALGLNPMGAGLMFNSGVVVTCQGGQPTAHCAGQPDGATVGTSPATADVRVRRAIAAAIDPTVLNERVYDGTANVTTEFFPEPIPWAPGVAGPEYDLDEAKRLVAEAKAGGWGGSVDLRVPNTNADFGIAVETMLELAGMDVSLNSGEDTSAMVDAVIARQDFEITSWSMGFSDEVAHNYAEMLLSFQPGASPYGYSTPALHAALDEVRVAATLDEQRAAMRSLAEVLTNDLPFVSVTLGEEVVLTSERLHGVSSTGMARPDFSTAYLAR